MAGFFGNHEIEDTIVKRSKGCGGCKLNRTCQTRNMAPAGDGKARIMIVGDAPGADDDRAGVPFRGQAGKYLKDILRQFDYDLDCDCLRTNAVTCMTPECRKPSDTEIDGCRPILQKEIERYKPTVIIAMGQTALEGLMGDRLESIGQISKWRGHSIPDRKYGAWICPTFHPNYVMEEIDYGSNERKRSNFGSAAEVVFKQDIENALEHAKIPVPAYADEVDGVTILRKPKQAIRELKRLLHYQTYTTFDYETTGLKPNAPGHEVVCVSFATELDEAFVFDPKLSNKVWNLWCEVLADKKLPKVAQNWKFEDRWSRWIFKTQPRGWFHDTMTATHIQDNRSGITGLKFQSIVRYGLIGYDKHISYYLKTDDNKGNSINRIREANLDEVMLYCGIDSIMEHRLFLDQAVELGIEL